MIRRKHILLATVSSLALAAPAQACQTSCTATHCNGINESGGDFATPVYPNHADMDWAASKGMSVIRVPFRWETIQPGALASGTWSNPPLNPSVLAVLDEVANYASTKGLTVLWDVHSYAQYKDPAGTFIVLGTPALPLSALADFWAQFAQHYAGSPTSMMFGLMNEPTKYVSPGDWHTAANMAIASIRAAGALQFVLVPGPVGSSLVHFEKFATYNAPFVPSATTGGGIFDPASVDPLHPTTWGIELHQYFDSNLSGTQPACTYYWGAGNSYDPQPWFVAVTTWARTHSVKIFLGEFAGGAPPHTGTANCQETITNIVTYIQANQDAWVGWSWFAGGAFPYPQYPFYMGPKAVPDVPQYSWIAPLLP